ncbi:MULTISPECIES: PPC domain-containing DNA-binding protein [Dethiosulfovibrio]|uniref:DNA-binding protein n=2 Tax=Dethiosulfovibrio TaxID=47054 RepID=A0ABS9EJJ1_9BACT|nr:MULTISPECIES: PPC domain-containing DNA-binding protein [Dethiosulfovibrio]MCF4112910.1 DNA-binding protein [Dethiosulfovibrio russensis]MCF4141374.1 DNA-binding protein [Dethiosulfovibrio marinus]MCF4144329.1 DNA-binding protein [Dethiosulfovibrio acidaminovorans]
MQYCGTEELLALHIEDGENLHGCIVTACRGSNVDSAVVISGLGMVSSVTFGWFTGKEYLKKNYDGTMELISLSGDISFRRDGMYPHLHGVFSSPDHQVIGGHIMEAIAMRNIELFLKPIYSQHFNRRDINAFEALIPERRS